MSEIKNGGLGLYGAEHSKCKHVITLGFKGLNCTVLQATLTPVISKLAKCCRVPKITASVLRGFSSRAFHHVDTASVQSAIDERSLNLDGRSESIRSSTY